MVSNRGRQKKQGSKKDISNVIFNSSSHLPGGGVGRGIFVSLFIFASLGHAEGAAVSSFHLLLLFFTILLLLKLLLV